MHEFIKQNDEIIVNVPYAEAYIPEQLFRILEKDSQMKSSVAYMMGDAVVTVGCFNMRFMDSEDDNPNKYPLRTFNYPSVIETRPTSISSKVKLHLCNSDDIESDSEDDTTEYRVLHYYRGDTMMMAKTTQTVANCEKFLSMMTSGKIPNTIAYSDLVTIWQRNFDMNDVDSGVPSVTMQCIIAEQCRSAKNPRIPFRKIIGAGKAKENDYMMCNMRTIASYNSTFSALTFEDMGAMLTSSINMTRQDTPQTKSPIEKVLSY